MHEDLKLKIFEIEANLSKLKSNDISLFKGATGVAIFYAHLFKLTGNTKFLVRCQSIVNFIIKKLSRIKIGHSFYNGLSGVAWGILYLQQSGFINKLDDSSFDHLDEVIFRRAEYDLESNNCDLLHGALGVALYALQRPEKPETKAFLNSFIAKLELIKEVDDYGFKWPDQDFIQHRNGQKVYNLGMAHGMPSIIEVLRLIHNKGLYPEIKILKLIQGALEWISHNKIMNPSSISIYPSCVFDNNKNHKYASRLAWCYGDLIISLTFWRCGKSFRNEQWKNEAIGIMNHSLKRVDPLSNQFLDAGFCHGTAGISHLYRKFSEETGNQNYKIAAQFWLDQTLKQARHRSGVAGFKKYHLTHHGEKERHSWRKEYGLLEGVAGIGLVLISSLSQIDTWDECLLLSP